MAGEGLRWAGGASAVVAVPALLFLIDEIATAAHGPAPEFLLVPPLAVIVFGLFSSPSGADGRLRAVVLLPVVGTLAAHDRAHRRG